MAFSSTAKVLSDLYVDRLIILSFMLLVLFGMLSRLAFLFGPCSLKMTSPCASISRVICVAEEKFLTLMQSQR